ncbi:hypothetical protein [Microcystis aeruginosa]|nr:hypothetical protein [Microcystis aeruginosa]
MVRSPKAIAAVVGLALGNAPYGDSDRTTGDDDLEIMRDLGLKFRTLLYELHPLENEMAVFKLEDFEFLPTKDFDSPYSSFMLFIKEHIEFFRVFVKDMDSCFVT